MYQWCMRVCMCNIQQYRSNLYVCWCLPFSRAISMRKKYVLRLWYVFPCMPICVSMMIGETKINNKTATFIVISSDRFFLSRFGFRSDYTVEWRSWNHVTSTCVCCWGTALFSVAQREFPFRKFTFTFIWNGVSASITLYTCLHMFHELNI